MKLIEMTEWFSDLVTYDSVRTTYIKEYNLFKLSRSAFFKTNFCFSWPNGWSWEIITHSFTLQLKVVVYMPFLLSSRRCPQMLVGSGGDGLGVEVSKFPKN